MENLKLKKHHKLVIAADGSAASGKTTGARLISKKYRLNFLSSGLLYRYANYLLIKHNTTFYYYQYSHTKLLLNIQIVDASVPPSV